MTPKRETLHAKIRALLSKTVANGCTEAEAMAALDKARAMMDAYEVTDAELEATKHDAAEIVEDDFDPADPFHVKDNLGCAVAAYTDTRIYRRVGRGRRAGPVVMGYVGLRPDVEQAQWLLESLADFVYAQLTAHLMFYTGSGRPRAVSSFVLGITSRVTERLLALVEQSKAKRNANANALVVIKDAAIAAKMKAVGMKLRDGRKGKDRMVDLASYAAGQAAGDKAPLGKPVNAEGDAAPQLTPQAGSLRPDWKPAAKQKGKAA